MRRNFPAFSVQRVSMGAYLKILASSWEASLHSEGNRLKPFGRDILSEIHHVALGLSSSRVQQVGETGGPLPFHQSLQFFQPYNKQLVLLTEVYPDEDTNTTDVIVFVSLLWFIISNLHKNYISFTRKS